MRWFAIVFAGIWLMTVEAPVAAAADAYEFVTIPPAAADTATGRAVFRINVATGQVVTAWGPAKTYSPTVEPQPLPAGEYHLRLTLTLDRKGGWNLERFDPKSGRLWSITGGGNVPFTWYEITEPQ